MHLINTSHATSCTDTQMDQFHCTWVSARGFLPMGLPYPWFFTVFMAFAKVDNNVVCQWIRGTALHTCMQTLMNVFFTMRSVVPANKIEVAIQVAFRNGKKHNSVRILAVEMQCWLCPHKRRTSNDHHHRMAVACLGLGRKKSCGHDAIQQ